ncbi:MAG: hypothetical protein PF440_04800 [Thiomicrorhabdus sp.]|jgi:hypothetical protein|nr:hypothetical protein [Thiomicrorhabdus sp.]
MPKKTTIQPVQWEQLPLTHIQIVHKAMLDVGVDQKQIKDVLYFLLDNE